MLAIDTLYMNDAVMTFKCIHRLVPDYLADKFISRSQITTRNTRQSNDLNIPRCRLATGQQSFAYRGDILWNDFSDSLKRTNSVKAFKAKLTHYSFNVVSIFVSEKSLWGVTNKVCM